VAEPSPQTPLRRGSGRRDLFVVATVVVVVFVLGLVTDGFDRSEPAIRAWTFGDELLAVLVLVSVATAYLGVRQARRARAEVALREASEARASAAELRYRTLVERVPIVAYTWDATIHPGAGSAGYVGPQIETLLGVTAAEWLDDPQAWASAVHPDDVERVLDSWSAATAEDAPFSTEYRLRRADGAWRWVRDEANPVGPGSGGSPMYQGVIMDITEAHDAAASVRAQEHRWRTLLEDLPMVAYEAAYADDGSIAERWVAHGIEALLGVAREAWNDDETTWESMLHPEDHDDVMVRWARLREVGEPFDMHYRLVRHDGSTVWVHDRAVRKERGGRHVVHGAFVDVTGRIQAETALQLAETRFRTLVEQLPAIVFAEDPHTGALTYVSPRIETIYGYTAQEWMADRTLWRDRLHPDDRDWVVASDEADTGDAWSVDYRSITRDGRMLWVHNEARLLRDANGAPLAWQGVVYDITERKEAEERLREAEERFRTLVEQLPVAVYTDAVDDVSTALYISPQYESLTGYTPEERLRVPDLWVRMLHPGDRDRVLAESDATNRTGSPFDTEYRIVAADGRVVWLHDHAVLVSDASGVRRWHGVLQDVTAQHTAAEAIARRDAILEATSYAAEHFLRGGSWEADLEEVLRRLAAAGDATRCAVFRNHALDDGALGVSIVASWPPEGAEADTATDRHDFAWEAKGFGRWVQELGAGRAIHGNIDGFPQVESDYLGSEPMAIRSLVAIPIFVDDIWWGYISFDHVDEERAWLEADVEALTLTGRTIGAAIERERATERYEEAQARYRTLIETIPAVTYIDTLAEPWSTVYVSPQVTETFGYAPSEWIRPGLWIERVHEDDREAARRAVAAHANRGTPFELEYRLQHRDGRWLWVRDAAFVVHDDDGVPLFSQGVMYDITDMKNAQERLRDAEQRYRAIVEHVPAAIYLDRPDGNMETVYISPQIRDIVGVEPERWLEHPSIWLDVMHPEDRPEVERSYLRAVHAGEPWRGEYRVRTPDGRTVWIHDETTFLHGSDGEPAFLQGVLFDITERKLAEQALRESEQRERQAAERLRSLDEMKNTFLAAVSHELRSPLTSILGLSLTLERTPDIPGPERDVLLTRLAVNARKLDRLLKDLLDIDRLNRGIVEPQYRVTDVAALARRTVEHLDATGDRSIIVTTDPVVLAIDSPKIERIIENLVMNAVRHTEADRRIWLSVHPHADGVEITVEDDGSGVPEELRTTIFEPFRQGPTPPAHSPGTGIGLSLVARFAELHGGRAWVGERDGGGAAFHVEIPGPTAGEVVIEPDEPRADVG
jgi:PAS domain S-box-containing protein